MQDTINAIRLLDALAGGIRKAPGPEGDDRIVAVSDDPMLVTKAIRTIADALDWRVDVVDAVRTNFHDLEADESPLARMVRFARESDIQHVIVVQSAVPMLIEDVKYGAILEGMAFDLPVVLCMAEIPYEARGWTVVDLRDAR